MTVTSGFFSSLGGDRLYGPDDFNGIFKGVLTEGVLYGYLGEFNVTEQSGMTVTVGSGKAWFNASWIENSSPLNLTLSGADPAQDRVDVVVLDFDKSPAVRMNRVLIVEGTPGAGTPILLDEEDHKQYPIATIVVGAGALSVGQNDIISAVGTASCPWSVTPEYLNGVVSTVQESSAQMGNDRNIIINGDFAVTQRVPETVDIGYSGYPGPDRWQVRHLLDTTEMTFETHTENNEYGVARTWGRIEVVSDGAPTNAAAHSTILRQRIEGYAITTDLKYGTPAAKTLSGSFRFKSSTPGVYVVNLLHGTRQFVYSFNYGTPDTIQDVSFVIPGDPTEYLDTATTDQALVFQLWLRAGTNFKVSAAGSAWEDTDSSTLGYPQVMALEGVGDYVQLTDVQLEVGVLPTSYVRLSYEASLERCQRYFEVFVSWAVGMCVDEVAQTVQSGWVPMRVPKRAAPTALTKYCDMVFSGDLKYDGNPYVTFPHARFVSVSATFVGGALSKGEAGFVSPVVYVDAEL